MTTTTERDAYTSGLRKLADLLDQHGDVPLPYGDIQWIITSDADQRATLARLARLLPGEHAKRVLGGGGEIFSLRGRIDGLPFDVLADRGEVCERIVVGTRVVTETVPDPAVVVPMVKVTKTVEDVEWRCGSVLAGADQ